ncbi:carbohydrate kinase family protein [Propioniciclava flava]
MVADPGAVFVGLPAEVREAVLARTTVWTSNQEEAEALVGSASMAEAATRIAALLPRQVRSASSGTARAGCAVHAGDAVVVVPGYLEEPVHTNGAGDAHTGVLVAEWAAGTDWVEACRRANVAGAIKVTRRGPATAPTSAEIDAFSAAEAAGADHTTA